MSGLADVIPIASRRARTRQRHPEAAKTPAPKAALPPLVLRKRVAIFCLGLVASMGVLMLIDHAVASHDVQAQVVAQPSPLRRGLYERAVADVTAACGLPEARAGLLREHCLDQAKFLTHLPECTGDCVRLTTAVLTPVR
jgi:hypothetical protein